MPVPRRYMFTMFSSQLPFLKAQTSFYTDVIRVTKLQVGAPARGRERAAAAGKRPSRCNEPPHAPAPSAHCPRSNLHPPAPSACQFTPGPGTNSITVQRLRSDFNRAGRGGAQGRVGSGSREQPLPGPVLAHYPPRFACCAALAELPPSHHAA